MAFQTKSRRSRRSSRDDDSLGFAGRDLELLAYGVERDDRERREVLADPRVLACAGQPAHDDDVAAEVLVWCVRRIVRVVSEVEDSRVRRRDARRRAETAVLGAELAEKLDVVEKSLLVRAMAAACVRFGNEREMIAAGDLADRPHGACPAARPCATASSSLIERSSAMRPRTKAAASAVK